MLVQEPDPPGLNLVKLHGYFPEAMELIGSGRAKAIYTFRDLRDVVVSAMHKWKHSFAEFATPDRIRKICMNDRNWRAIPGILVTPYAGLVGDTVGEIRRVAKHLGLPCDDSFAAELGEKLSLPAQKRRIESFDYQSGGIERDGSVLAPDSLLHSNHINSGETGQWRGKLTGYQVAMIEAWSGDWLPENGFPFEHSGLVRKALNYRALASEFLSLLPRRVSKVLANPLELRRLWKRPTP